MGLFANMFDMNRDGKLNGFERAMEYSFFMELQKADTTVNSDLWDDEDLF